MPRLAFLPWLWLGAALLFAVVVAPSAFAVLPSRALAGLLVGRVLPVLFWTAAVIGALMVATTTGWRRGAAAVLLASALGAQFGVAPRIQRLRVALGPDIEAVAPTDERRVAFGRLHAVSVALLGVGMLGAAALAIATITSATVSGTPGVPGVTPQHDSARR